MPLYIDLLIITLWDQLDLSISQDFGMNLEGATANPGGPVPSLRLSPGILQLFILWIAFIV